jgi:predicted nucleotidyltransferase
MRCGTAVFESGTSPRPSYAGACGRLTPQTNRMPRTNIEQLIATAELVRPLLGDLVFVGGVVTSLLVTDEGAGAPRLTLDVDAIVEVTSYAEYAAFGERLRALGFAEDTREGAPLCRWVRQEVILDVMPLDEKILGFSNRWYRGAMNAAVHYELPGGIVLRVVTAPYFLATKIEAFHGRGIGGFFASHDLEDLIFVVDGRSSIVEDVQAQAPLLRQYLRVEVAALLALPAFIDALPGYLLPDAASQARAGIIMQRLKAIASI